MHSRGPYRSRATGRRWQKTPGLIGGWRGVFAQGTGRSGVTIFNSYSGNDAVLRTDLGLVDYPCTPDSAHSWLACQVKAKPY